MTIRVAINPMKEREVTIHPTTGWRHKITPSVRKKCVKMLRSGDYKQITGKLYQSSCNGYCAKGILGLALGVEASLMDEAVDLPSTCIPIIHVGEQRDGLEYTPSTLEEPMALAYEFAPERLPLNVLNDYAKLTFDQIADLMENKPVSIKVLIHPTPVIEVSKNV